MRIRWKLLILLVTISLVPLSVALWFGGSAAIRLTDDLAIGARETLTSGAERFLLQTVRDHSKLLDSEADALEQSLRVQAREVERCLVGDSPDSPEIHLADDFDSDGVLADLVTSDRHLWATADGTVAPMRISYDRQSFLLAPGVEQAQVADDLARLSTLLPTYQLIHQSQPGSIHWQYTALGSGVHTAYPGHGHYPEGFDPRQRQWYQRAKETGAPWWSAATVDASTRQAVLTLAMPVHRPSGSFAGVTAIDIRVTDLVRRVELPARWARESTTMIVFPYDDDDGGQRGIFIVAQQGFKANDEWDVPASPPLLTSGDERQLEQMFSDLTLEKAAVREMPYEGRRSLWAYGPLPETGAALMVVIPYERVLTPALAAEADVRGRMQTQRRLVGTLLGGVFVVVVVLSLLASRHVTRPIRELAAGAHRVAAGDLDTPTRVTTRDELGELGAAFNTMLPQLRDHMRVKHALSVAMEVQQSLLPEEPPQIAGLDIAGRSIYCDETGGDYYDFIDLSRISPHTLGVAVGDVTGHGIAAALLMATARALLRSRVGEPCSLGALLGHMNRHLAADVPTGKFMTLQYLLLDTEQHTVRWTSAGHDPAIVYDRASQSFSELAGGGIPLGIEADWPYEEYGPRALQPGQVIVIGTDGIWETCNREGEMFGKQRLQEVIRAAEMGSADEISQAITDAIAHFRGDCSQDDDVTLVVIKVRYGRAADGQATPTTPKEP